jgi:hypothetical protein
MTKYEEEIYPSRLITDHGHIWVFANWKKTPKKHWKEPPDMPVMIFSYWDSNGDMVALHHQSLQ